MTDSILAKMLEGLRTRPEFYSLCSTFNEVGEQSSKQICKLLSGTVTEDGIVIQDEGTPLISELKLINSRFCPASMDKIIESIRFAPNLVSLSLQKMDLSERQITALFDYVKYCKLEEFDISWNKVPLNQLVILFEALENNSSLKNLNLGWI